MSQEEIPRRRFLAYGGGAIVATFAFGLGGLYLLGHKGDSQVEGILPNTTDSSSQDEVFPGTPGGTRATFIQWENELKEDPSKLKSYLPRIERLAIAAFCNEMGYDKNQIENKIKENRVFLDKEEFFTKRQRCGEVRETAGTIGFVDMTDDTLYLNKEPDLQKEYVVGQLFTGFIHELLHYASPRKIFTEQTSQGKTETFYQKGLIGGVLTKEKCIASSGEVLYILEEAIVEDATQRIVLKYLGGIWESSDKKHIDIYVQKILSLYGGNNSTLLKYHQDTNLIGFFCSIGEKLGVKGEQEQFEKGKAYVFALFA